MTQKLVRHHCHNFYKMMEQDMPTDHYLMLMRLLVFFLSLAGLQVREKQSNSSELSYISYHSVFPGLPKGVMLSQSNLTSTICLTNNIASGCARAPFDPSSGMILIFGPSRYSNCLILGRRVPIQLPLRHPYVPYLWPHHERSPAPFCRGPRHHHAQV